MNHPTQKKHLLGEPRLFNLRLFLLSYLSQSLPVSYCNQLAFVINSASYSATLAAMTEGIAPFPVEGLSEPCQTWYKVVGDLRTSAVPLIVLHGGPGACHDYLLPLTDLAPEIPLVFYDQIGNGRSTHLPEKNGDEQFWSVDLFKKELDNLLQHLGLQGRPVDIYGHSWGGMLAAEWAAAQPGPSNLRRLVLSNSLASVELFLGGLITLKKQLPQDVQEVLDRAEETHDFESPEYEAAVEVFYKRHLSLARPWPAPEVQAALDWFAKDPTTYWYNVWSERATRIRLASQLDLHFQAAQNQGSHPSDQRGTG